MESRNQQVIDWEELPTSTLVFYVNGVKVEDSNVDPEWTLLEYLRKKLHLCGTKLGCGEGGCGACTVMVSRKHHTGIQHLSVNACLAPVCSMHGAAVTTVEGIGNTAKSLHPVQERLAKAHGSQCGFCTPGFVMSMYTLLRNSPKPSYQQMEDYFQGNLCRCTGYRPIMEGCRSFLIGVDAGRKQKGCCQQNSNGKCCMDKENSNENITTDVTDRLHDSSTYLPYDPTQEPIFPSELQIDASVSPRTLKFKSNRVSWYRPASIEELLDLKTRFPGAKLVVGNTELGVETRLKFFYYPVLISTGAVSELSAATLTESGVEVGAAITLSRLQDFLCHVMKGSTDSRCQIFASILEMLKWFASRQIRNVACLGGNIMTGSPISDLNPILMAAGAKLRLRNTDEERIVELNSNFYTGYRKNISKPNEVLISVFIPFTSDNQYFWCYKQAKRKDDDIAIVNAAYNVTFEHRATTVRDLKAAYGGMAPTTVMAQGLMKIAKGRCWDEHLVEAASKALMEEFRLSVDTPGGQVHYRRALTISLFFKFYQQVLMLREQGDFLPNSVSNFHSPEACQVFQKVPSSQPSTDLVGRPIVHSSAFKQTCGEAVYADDLPPLHNELQAALVQSTQASADILDIDPSKALAMDGVRGFFCAKDISKKNNQIADEEVFASEKVHCQGQVIGLIVAEDRLTARRAAREVKVKYAPTKPIITIQDAIDQSSFFNESPYEMGDKDVENEMEKSEHVLQGEAYIGPQEHFYLEPGAVIAIPKEDNEMEVVATTQNPTDIQVAAAHILGVPLNRVTVSVRRIGGGFGGKETRTAMITNPVVVAAKMLKRSVRCVLDRDEDMGCTGGRHPLRAYYKVGCTSEGRITALDLRCYLNAGFSLDLSIGVLNRVLLSSDNAYFIPHTRVRAWNCKTNLPSNTAFRGFGSPQAMFVCETIVDEVATYFGLPSHEVRRLNLYKEGQLTYHGMKINDNNIRRCYESCLKDSQYENKIEQSKEFNRNNRWRKRGVAVVPTKYGIGFGLHHLNQAGVLTHIYMDSSVLISCAGVEMGQGLHTKLIQIASRALGIDASKIYISHVSTDKVPNTSATAASFSSDLNGAALLNSCEKLLSRLKPVIEDNPEGSWEEWVKEGYQRRISLSATGLHAPNDPMTLFKSPEAAFLYFTYGAAVSEVEIDCLTGDHEVLSTYIVMDVGQSLNPAIDIGQIEGAWMQGYGLFTMEEPLISPSGFILTRGPGNYKIPSFSDMPKRFNVSLLQGSSNPRAIYSSKAIGEPPLFLASSVFFAIKSAIVAARKEAGFETPLKMNAPATSEKIRLACQDQFTKSSLPEDDGTKKPWNITV